MIDDQIPKNLQAGAYHLAATDSLSSAAIAAEPARGCVLTLREPLCDYS